MRSTEVSAQEPVGALGASGAYSPVLTSQHYVEGAPDPLLVLLFTGGDKVEENVAPNVL